MSFGKKGLAQGQSAPQQAGFGKAAGGVGAMPAARKQSAGSDAFGNTASDSELAAKREAFIASERARSNFGGGATAASPLASSGLANDGGAGGRPVAGNTGRAGAKKYLFGDPAGRSLILAYVLWYFACIFSIHRFYCGHGESAWYQIGLLCTGFFLGFIWIPMGVAALAGWLLWIFADLFLMPGMMRRFKAQHDYRGVFA